MRRVTGNGHDFYMDETPVTYADYSKYVQQGAPKNAYWEYPTYNIPEQPVTGISWISAIEYCNWRSRCENLTPAYSVSKETDFWGNYIYVRDTTANGYRLPTSTEFEFAATAGKNQNYPWGNDFINLFANYDEDHGQQTTIWWRLAPVTAHYCNAFGLFNMCGNNWHWCDDWVETNRTKYLKGGSWGSISPALLTASNFSWGTIAHYNYDIGFRCVRPVGSNDTLAPYTLCPFQSLSRKPFERGPGRVNGYNYKSELTRFLADNFPESIYFLQPVDSQQVLTPEQMADLLINTCEKHHVNPLFLTAIMVSESGFGTVSFPRWYNNPMAYHWQNKLMVKGLPVYADQPGKLNRKFATLEQGFDAFCKGIRRDIYYKAAIKNLDAFHLVYVGYRADEWMNTLSRVYREVAGMDFQKNTPNAGHFIYTDWNTLKEKLQP